MGGSAGVGVDASAASRAASAASAAAATARAASAASASAAARDGEASGGDTALLGALRFRILSLTVLTFLANACMSVLVRLASLASFTFPTFAPLTFAIKLSSI